MVDTLIVGQQNSHLVEQMLSDKQSDAESIYSITTLKMSENVVEAGGC